MTHNCWNAIIIILVNRLFCLLKRWIYSSEGDVLHTFLTVDHCSLTIYYKFYINRDNLKGFKVMHNILYTKLLYIITDYGLELAKKPTYYPFSYLLLCGQKSYTHGLSFYFESKLTASLFLFGGPSKCVLI